MDKIKENRRKNLQRLARNYRFQRQLAVETGVAAAHVSQLLGGVQGMGEDIALRIEKSLGLPPGFMSLDPDDPSPSPTTDSKLHELPDDEMKLLIDYRRALPRHREMVLEMASTYARMDSQ